MTTNIEIEAKVEMGVNQLEHTGIKNILSLETTRRQLRCESSKNPYFRPKKAYATVCPSLEIASLNN